MRSIRHGQGHQKMTKLAGLAAVLLGAAVTSGCSEPFHLNWDTSLLVDAQHRAILNVPLNDGDWSTGQVRPRRVFCAEASPDVAIAVNRAFGADVAVNVAGQGNGSLGADYSRNERVAQLAERLATIQLLRDGLYQACQAYANGAINSTTYAVLISGIDDTLVTTLMGEMAAGAFGRSGAALGTNLPTATAQALQERLTQARDKYETASRALATARNGSPQPAEITRLEGEERRALQEYQAALNDVAAAGSAAMGAIASRADQGVAHELNLMHANFLQSSDGMQSLMIACIMALDRTSNLPAGSPGGADANLNAGPATARVTPLASACSQIVSTDNISHMTATRTAHLRRMTGLSVLDGYFRAMSEYARNCTAANSSTNPACVQLNATIVSSGSLQNLRDTLQILINN